MTNDKNQGPEDFGDDAPFEDFDGGKGLEKSPLMKVGIVLGALAAVGGGVILFGGGDKKQVPVSSVRAGNEDLKETPGTAELSDSYKKALEESNQAAVEQAERSGGSALPVPVTPPVGRLDTPIAEKPAEEDPLARWRRIQEERQRREVEQQKEIQAAQAVAPVVAENNQNTTEAVNRLAEAMAQQMESVLNQTKPGNVKVVAVTSPNYLEAKAAAAVSQPGTALATAGMSYPAGAQAPVVQEPINILLPAGSVEYAQLLTEANSDAQAPILAQLVSGPLNGSRMIGSFETREDFLVLNFNMIVVDGISYPIQAMAIDAKTTTPGLVTDIDRRYFKRVLLPAAAAFIEGMGGAIAESGSTNVTVSGDTVIQEDNDIDTKQELYKGVEKAASELGDVFEDDKNVKPLIKVRPGTPMGIVFLQPVTDQTAAAATTGQMPLQAPMQGSVR